MPTAPHQTLFIGCWKITSMEVWGQEYVDLVGPGHITFEMEGDHLMGSFQFGTVTGWMDCRVADTSHGPLLEWSWEGRSDTDPGCGRGWARIDGGNLVGRIFIHASDDSAFEAAKRDPPKKKVRPIPQSTSCLPDAIACRPKRSR